MNYPLLEQKLVDIGLSPPEAATYIALLRLGKTSILEISRATEIKRTTVYNIIESLKARGLVSNIAEGFKHYLVAENPDRLLDVVETRIEQFRTHLPELQSLYIKHGATSAIKSVSGLRNIQHVYTELLKSTAPGDEYMVITNQSDWYNSDPAFFQKFIEKRADTGARIRVLCTDSAVSRAHKQYEQNYNMQVRVLPAGTILATNTVITPHMLLIHKLTDNPTALVISDNIVIATQQQYFELLWNSINTA